MNDEALEAIERFQISQETLRAFAKGQLDEKQELRVLDALEKSPDLAAQVAAISVDSVIAKMRDHGQLVSDKSLSSQLAGEPLGETELIAVPAQLDSKVRNELESLSDFTDLKEIGRGGMGVLYLARHTLTGRKEVLKVLNERLIVNQEARKRFEQEIKCIAATNHESIVRCYSVMQLRSTIVLCMEYVPGKNLHQVIANSGPLPVHIACAIAIKICLGLQHAMDHGLVHRDIKPSNIMLSKADGKIKAKILDFGLARLTNCGGTQTGEIGKALTDDGILLGTLEYIAPEQCRDAASADIRSDLYSLGCTLYHMIVGHPPFTGSTGELVFAHSQTIPPAIDRIRPEVPKSLADLVARLLHKDPSSRFRTPIEVAEALTPHARRETSADDSSASRIGREDSIDTQVEPRDQTNNSVLSSADNIRRFDNRSDSKKRTRVIALVACLAVLVSLLGLSRSLSTDQKGTVVISNLPAEAVVFVDGDPAVVKRSGIQGTVQVDQGERELTVAQSGQTLLETSIRIPDGGEVTLLVTIDETRSLAPSGVSPEVVSSATGDLAKLPELAVIQPTRSREYILGGGTGINEQRVISNLETDGLDYHIDANNDTFVLRGNASPNIMLQTKRRDFRNFHLRIEMMIDSADEASKWNQHFVLRANQIGTDKIGWRAMLGGHRPHAGVLHQVVPFGLMGILVRPFPGYPDGKIGVPYFDQNRLVYHQHAPGQSMTRDEFHMIEYIVYGPAIELFLDGRFICSATDPLDRVDHGGILLAKPPAAEDVFREISILELGNDEEAERYAKAMALAMAKD
ncbi:serine/threonine protein kinase [Rhodopirellula sp. MGV]|uniref:serine/threonine protein kinase n=1 Tax=Rhodopirellula sp. MGV TaxID=2023130 RepID=UPI000B961DA1|nr:serine/threonine-protein kinase [Rhodopirellula sp. MGV]OYP38152.1 hypothetical protein CGZ80_02675 [Rhodopirellula sp. MGV]PNY38492.1 serine/threonine protein kinase [Rhodopirellula baltica]